MPAGASTTSTVIFFTQININSIRETLDNSGAADGHDPLRDGPLRLHRLGLHSDVPGRSRRAGAEPGDLVVFMGSGGGLAFACAAFTW